MADAAFVRDTTAAEGALLGVAHSFRGRRWRERLDGGGRATALAIAQRHGVPEVLARVLAGRGVTLDLLPGYLKPTLRELMPDPYRLTAMEAAAGRLADAVTAGETIAIFGDYDVDGATSSAVLGSFFAAAGAPFSVYIPDRIFEGYGPNVEAVRGLATAGARLIVTVDCGTTSFDALEEARRLGVDVVVLDHHQVAAELPPAVAVVNPNRADDLSGLGQLAAAGVTFLAVVAVNRLLRQRGHWTAERPEPDLLALLDLVALGTVADVVPLTGLNRALVGKGLIAMAERRRAGLAALADRARLDGPPTPYHLGFLLGPRINAGGRIGRADLGARLLLASDPAEAATLAEELDRLNAERQALEQATLAEADAEAIVSGSAVIAAKTGWHPGIMGLVAARLKERHGLPAFAIAIGADGVGIGSGRSIAGVDLGRAVRRAVEAGLLVKGGGHAMAAGVTVAGEALPGLRAFLDLTLTDEVATARVETALAIDAVVAAAGLTPDLVRTMEQAGPFGAGNPAPVVALAGHVLAHAEPVGQGGHLRLGLRAGDGTTARGIAFRAMADELGPRLIARRGTRVHVAGTVALDRWGGRERVDLRVIDAAAAD
ncbi:MAG TPA: single-stranded-DNA-specific exonuclease RecJ [Hyphomicrobiales bacterium]|nr:single-stranded-DNA-specific exonuclease RecJ [Hyphomicrobiales bacterium]